MVSKPGRSARFAILTGLSLVLLAGIAGTIHLNRTRSLKQVSEVSGSRIPTPEELAKKAEPFFSQVENNVPSVVNELSGMGNLSRLCWLMACDKLSGTQLLQKHLESVLESPIIQPCREGVRIYGFDFDSAVFQANAEAICSNYAIASIYAVSGLALEALFLKTTIASFHRILGSIVARFATTLSISGACAIIDGPLPLGDAIGVAFGVGGTAWCAYNLWRCQKELPIELTAVLHQMIQDCREVCRKAVQP